ncbi:MAG: ABC transporter ATP-binding protein, partial [Streptosporangiaceae bacterium]
PAMNVVAAELVRDDGPGVVFAGQRLPVPQASLAAHPGLEDYFGRQVIVGVRPSDFEDATVSDHGWPTMPARADVTEELGSEVNIIFMIDAPPVVHKDTSDLAHDTDEETETAIPLAGDQSMWTARVNARSRVRPGQTVTLAVDTGHLHYFDPDSGLAIGHPQAHTLTTTPSPAQATP